MILKRFFDENTFEKLKSEFAFLIENIKADNDNFGLSLGNNHVALYFKAQPMAKIEFSPFGDYETMIPKAFLPDVLRDDKQFNFRESARDSFAELNLEKLKNLFSQEMLKSFKEHFLKNDQPAPLAFAHDVIEANKNRSDFIILDRNVTDGDLKGKRMNMMALEKNDLAYGMRIIEICFKADPAAEDDLGRKSSLFLKNTEKHFADYKTNFENNYEQRQRLGLYDEAFPEKIDINHDIKSLILYPPGQKAGDNIKKHFPEIKLKELSEDLKI
jgi:hypothetical protein